MQSRDRRSVNLECGDLSALWVFFGDMALTDFVTLPKKDPKRRQVAALQIGYPGHQAILDVPGDLRYRTGAGCIVSRARMRTLWILRRHALIFGSSHCSPSSASLPTRRVSTPFSRGSIHR